MIILGGAFRLPPFFINRSTALRYLRNYLDLPGRYRLSLSYSLHPF
jgi:hypothetical protein